MNKKAFRLGRAALNNSEAIRTLLDGRHPIREQQRAESSDDKIARLTELLSESHGKKAASTLSGWVGMVRQVCGEGQLPDLAAVVAESGFQVLYSKDEYEVARLYTHPRFRQSLAREFTGDFSLKVHLAPPILSRNDSATGRPVKRAFGSWIFIVFQILSRLRWARDTWLDPFRYTRERQLAREIRKEYERTLERLCAGFDRGRPQIAEHIAQWPIQVRGFGPVRQEAFKKAVVDLEPLWRDFLDDPKSDSKAA
jgi:indolepyruvate ferredoxin oxidoreductase